MENFPAIVHEPGVQSEYRSLSYLKRQRSEFWAFNGWGLWAKALRKKSVEVMKFIWRVPTHPWLRAGQNCQTWPHEVNRKLAVTEVKAEQRH